MNNEPIVILTNNTPRVMEVYPLEATLSRYIMFKVYSNNNFYFADLDVLNTTKSHPTKWIIVTEDDFIQAVTLNKLGGYEYVETMLKGAN